MELASLLQELLKRGWKVYGDFDKLMSFGQDGYGKSFGFGVLGEVKFSLRELVSKESGLWQFVCENKLIEPDHMKQYNGYEYWLCESALKDESELEQFLLDNIKI